MVNFIKNIKPKKNSRYKQGYVNPKSCQKYAKSCSNEPIFYRSGLELEFMQYCENSSSIVKWASEPINIPYYSRLDKKQHNYYPDFIIENAKGEKCIVEIKPENQRVKPDMCDTAWLKEQYIRNQDKWNAAYQFAHKHGMKFIIVTEKFFE